MKEMERHSGVCWERNNLFKHFLAQISCTSVVGKEKQWADSVADALGFSVKQNNEHSPVAVV